MNLRTLRMHVTGVVIALVAGLCLIAATPSESFAAPRRAKSVPTTIAVSATTVPAGSTVKITGRTSTQKREVVLQKYVNGWTKVASTNSKSGSFSFNVKVAEGSHRYRAFSKKRVVSRSLTLKKTVSAAITIQGKRASTTPTTPTPPKPPVTIINEDPSVLASAAFLVRTYVNNNRTAVGLTTKFANNTCLGAFAMTHSQSMARYQEFAHSPEPFFASIGSPSILDVCSTEANPGRSEVIALVYADTADAAARAAVDSWIASPAHRAIIEDAQSTGLQMGVGVARTSDGYWWITAGTAFSW